MSSHHYNIHGSVIRSDSKQPVGNVRVELWRIELDIKNPLTKKDIINKIHFIVSAYTDSYGKFEMSFDVYDDIYTLLNRVPDFFFRVYQRVDQQDKLVLDEEHNPWMNVHDGDHDATLTIDETLLAPLKTEQTSDDSQKNVVNEPVLVDAYSVNGEILDRNNEPLRFITVKAFDRDLRSEELLGETKTNEKGNYVIRYTIQSYKEKEINTADLFIKVFDSKERLLATSKIIFNAKTSEVINIKIGDAISDYLSEYDKNLNTIQHLLGNQKIVDLQEDEVEDFSKGKFKDVTFLSRETEIPFEFIQYLILSFKYSTQVDIHPAYFYGFFREGLPTQLNLLVAQTPLVLNQALQLAWKNDIISVDLKKDTDKVLKLLSAYKISQPEFLLNPSIFFSNLNDLKHLTEEQSTYIINKLNAKLKDEIVKQANSDQQLKNIIQSIIVKLDYREFLEETVSTIFTKVITPELKGNSSFTGVAENIENNLNTDANIRVADLLNLNKPLQNNPLFTLDVRQAKTFTYCKLSALNDESAKELLNKGLSVDDLSPDSLDDLVKEKIINSKERKKLQFTIDIGKLSGDNTSVIQSVIDNDLQQTADLISWQHNDWLQLLNKENIKLPPNETVDSYADTITYNIEKTYASQVLLNRVLKNNDKVISGDVAIDWHGLSSKKVRTLKDNLEELQSFSNTFKHLNLDSIINDSSIDSKVKKEEVNQRIESLSTFYKNNPELDLLSADLFSNYEKDFNWKSIPVNDKKLVRNQLLAYQRALTLAETVTDSQKLLSKGFDSAVSIANMSEADFIQNSGLELGKARLAYSKSQDAATVVAHNYQAIHDVMRGGFSKLYVNNIDPSLVNDLQEIDGFADLFGCQDYCDCAECKSIFSPAAYFVDLMHFIEQNISIPVFVNKNLTNNSLYLKNRRNDLWKLNLTCENTTTSIPYLTIVDEVLETYLNKVFNTDIFEKMSKSSANISFNLPFNLPLEELRLYLSHFSLTLSKIYSILKQPAEKVLRASLYLSIDEFQVISTPKPAEVKFRYGNQNPINEFNVQDFIGYAGITRSQLDELLLIKYHTELKTLLIENKSNPNDIQSCEEVIKHLNIDTLDFIHRFIRLWKKTPWTITEFDLVLISLVNAKFITPDLNGQVVLLVAQSFYVQQTLALKLQELCVMIDQLPVSTTYPLPPIKQSDLRLFETLFDLKGIFGEKDPATHELNISIVYHHYSLNTNDPTDKKIDTKTPLLLAGLGISETELLLLFALLKNEMPFDADGNCTIDRKRISLLYRHAKLAKSLKFTIEDFIQVLRFIFETDNLVIVSLDQITKLIDFKSWFVSTPFKVPELQLILFSDESATLKYRFDLNAITSIVLEVQASQETDKLTALRTSLQKAFNINSNQLADILQWNTVDINNAGIETAISAEFNNGVPTDSGDLNKLTDLIHNSERTLLLFSNLKFSEQTITYLTTNAGFLGINDIKNITIENIKATSFYYSLISQDNSVEPIVQKIFSDYAATHSFETGIFNLSDIFKQDKSLVSSLIKSLDFPAIPLDALKYFSEYLSLCQTLAINGFSLQLMTLDDSYEKLITAADIALGAFSSKYDDVTLSQQKLEPYHDAINVKKRDALCDYIIASQKDLKFKTLDDIYAFFLLDVKMSGCFRISRLVCAISSLQLYVHRVLINLENSSTTGLAVLNEISKISANRLQEFSNEWLWRKNYRVWEANRKVFVYPESYMEPDLRDNKTPVFEDLENELLQEKITQEAAEDAYKKYLTQFAELARLKIAGSYYHTELNTYYFFGKTQQDPPQYYYRKWVNNTTWTAWEKIDLAINCPSVSAIIKQGKLYLFWVDAKTKDKTQISGGTQTLLYTEVFVDLYFSCLDENNKWIAPQKLSWLYPSNKETISANNQIFYVDYEDRVFEMELSKSYLKVYPYLTDNNIILRYLNKTLSDYWYDRKLDLFNNRLVQAANGLDALPNSNLVNLWLIDSSSAQLAVQANTFDNEMNFDIYGTEEGGTSQASLTYITEPFPLTSYNSSDPNTEYIVDAVHNKFPEIIIKFSNLYYLIHDVSERHLLWKRTTVPLSTSLIDTLGEKLFTKGIEEFLSLETQSLTESFHPFAVTRLSELSYVLYDYTHINFIGPYGNYYRELFRDIPWLIASQLNADNKFEEANWWYERIFNPTAPESPTDPKKTDRVWRYIEFRGLTAPTLKEILTDNAAIEKYKQDPFNPFAIARLRISAYQKAIVMKYIDNLLDWGDYLFAQDSVESINEATMLYVLASDTLGKRPVKLGPCDTVNDEKLTYENIGPAIKDSEFLITLESWSVSNQNQSNINKWKTAVAQNVLMATLSSKKDNAISAKDAEKVAMETADKVVSKKQYQVLPYEKAVSDKNRLNEKYKAWEKPSTIIKSPGLHLSLTSSEVFCVPPNYELLKYWDLVEDRLNKIRNCMNISGIRRQLSLFQPPIDPMLLVRAKAAGLSLEEVVALANDRNLPPPPYRCTFLIEKAKQYTQTVQSFGNALLSALEKKDGEELTLLRSVHERNILQMMTTVKTQQVQEAQNQYQAVIETQTNVQNRIEYYTNLIDEGLIGWENVEEISRHTATIIEGTELTVRLAAAIAGYVPQVGSPFAMTYGGIQIEGALAQTAESINVSGKIAELISASAGLEATFQRREQDWRQQLLYAQQEYKQVAVQLLAADNRQISSAKDLEIHLKNIDQAEELDAFYKGKFTSLGLYTYLSTTLNRLYREAYNLAYNMALMAQTAYQFERDEDNIIYISGNNWQYDKAGLLAGEQLLLQLQQMEIAYIKNNIRDYEINQSFSLALLDPTALLSLKQTGTCNFKIDEIAFDIFYPGQYKRLIKSVRLSIPCIVGPYTNVSTRLTLLDSWVRTKDDFNKGDLNDEDKLKIAKDTSITTSSAQNDSGMFELNFRDERYLPFEGAGAISSWQLDLPSVLRSFNYDTISDVIFHISYTAKYDGVFRNTVEDNISDALNNYAQTNRLFRIISLRHEFPNSFNKLFNTAGQNQTTDFDITRQIFPYFLNDMTLNITSPVTIYLKSKTKDPIDTTGFVVKVNDEQVNAWNVFDVSLKAGDIAALGGSPIKKWTISADNNALKKDEVDDILILIKYTVGD